MSKAPQKNRIPIVIGVTGHRELRECDIPRFKELVTSELSKLIELYPHTEFIMLNSIASGADTLCAEAALELGMKLVCPLPLPANEYREDFSGDAAAAFNELLQRAHEVFVAPDAETAPAVLTRDHHYRQAGIYIAAHSHLLLALWDGSPAKMNGCGTAEVVEFMLKGDHSRGYFRAMNDGAVLHIHAPRHEAVSPVFVRLIENERGNLREILSMTDGFNADAALVAERNTDMLIKRECLENANEGLRNIHALYSAADSLSLRFRGLYLSAMKSFSVFGVLLVMFFLLYDELECNMFLVCYGALILVYALAFILVRRGRYHAKYLQYRLLSEALRAQFYLSAAGMSDNIGGAFTWTQKRESTWIKEAVSALLIGAPAETSVPDDIIKEYWIDGQLTYHQSAMKRDSGKHRVSESAARGMLIASVSLFVLVLALEFLFGTAMDSVLVAESALTLRSLMKILLGGISAVTVFLANYYGKLSLGRKTVDHESMAALYATAKEQYESGRVDSSRLFRELAREELIECGNWFSYCQESPPSFNV